LGLIVKWARQPPTESTDGAKELRLWRSLQSEVGVDEAGIAVGLSLGRLSV
jgi:hypothetical protein